MAEALDDFLVRAEYEPARMTVGSYDIVTIDVVDAEATRVYVDHRRALVVLGHEAWRRLDGDDLGDFLDEVTGRGPEGMRDGPFWLSQRAYWTRALRRSVSDTQPAGDRLTDLGQRVEQLLTEAASLNASDPSPVMLTRFAQQGADLAAEASALEAELARVRGKLVVASEAVLRALA